VAERLAASQEGLSSMESAEMNKLDTTDFALCFYAAYVQRRLLFALRFSLLTLYVST
jgi:hypothetical protein